jgi:hypothetical protein
MAKIVLAVLAVVVLFTTVAQINPELAEDMGIDPLLMAALFVLGAVLVFFLQFSLYEIIVGRKGVLKSFPRSFNIVKSNMPNVIVFDIVFLILALILYFAEQILFYALASMGELIAALSDINYLLMVVAFAPFAIFALGMILIGAVISYFVYVVPIYFLWKRLGTAKEQENIKKPTTK